MKVAILTILILNLLLLSLLACSNNAQQTALSGSAIAMQPEPTVRTIPTLYPTATDLPTVSPTSTHPPEPTEVPSTPIDFEQVAVDVRYKIPSISLDRRIVANVANRIVLEDLTTGDSVELPDQPGILLELQQVFKRVVLEELPVGCNSCVAIDYRLPIAEIQGSGWLTDTQLLASIENFTSVHLSPHFPPGSVVGLRQSATAYHVAQSIAVTSDNLRWQWAATESQVGQPIASNLLADLSRVLPDQETLEEVQKPVAVDCPSGPGVETLMIFTAERPLEFRFSCPDLSLPTTLVPLYTILDSQFKPVGDDDDIIEPEPMLELDTVVKYMQTDGVDLTIYSGGTSVLTTTQNISHTTILTESLVISKTAELIDSNKLQTGASAFLTQDANVLFIRGPFGVYSYAWVDEEDQVAGLIQKTIGKLIEVIESVAEEQDDVQSGVEPTPATTRAPE